MGTAIILFALGGLITVYNRFIPAFAKTTDTIRAGYLVEEGLEAVRFLRDNAWSQSFSIFSTSSPYYLYYTPGTDVWAATTTATTTIERFYRTMTVSDVRRDAVTSDIVSAGGAVDTGTKKVTIAVAWWAKNATSTRQASMYITNLFSN